jgi:hypothetical protein
MTTVTNSSADEWYLPTVGVTLKPGESWSDDVKPEAAVKASKAPKTDPAPEPAEPTTVPADTQES